MSNWVNCGVQGIVASPVDGSGVGVPVEGRELRPVRRQVRTNDGVELSVIDTGEHDKPALLFVHGLSQSALCWDRQFASARLRARFRLVAVDLRGHGQSQGAFGAIGVGGQRLPTLDPAAYCRPGDQIATAHGWSQDISAVIGALDLQAPTLVGWSYGAVVICDYMATHAGLGADSKVVLMATTPGLMPPGTPEVGGDRVFSAAVPPAVFKTLDLNLLEDPVVPSTPASVIDGLSAFVALALADSVAGRPPATRDEIVSAVAYNLLLPPEARQAIISREIDHRAFLVSLSDADRKKIRVICGGADAVMQSANTSVQFQRCGLEVDVLTNEGHSFFARNPALFEDRLLGFIDD